MNIDPLFSGLERTAEIFSQILLLALYILEELDGFPLLVVTLVVGVIVAYIFLKRKDPYLQEEIYLVKRKK
jgi:uncharacterized membrane protein